MEEKLDWTQKTIMETQSKRKITYILMCGWLICCVI